MRRSEIQCAPMLACGLNRRSRSVLDNPLSPSLLDAFLLAERSWPAALPLGYPPHKIVSRFRGDPEESSASQASERVVQHAPRAVQANRAAIIPTLCDS